MTSDIEKQAPFIDGETTPRLTDYFCPFCDHKLFRGNVNGFNMVCPNCNKLVRSADIPAPETINRETLGPQ